MSAEFERLVQEFEKFQAKLAGVAHQAEQVDRIGDEIAALEGRATSGDRTITVVAGPGGSIKEIQLTPTALDLGAPALGGAILTTLQQAVADVARRQAAVVERYAGDDMHLLDQVLQVQAEVFGTTVEALRSAVDGPSPDEPADDDTGYPIRRHEHRGRPTAPPPPPPAADGSDSDRFLDKLLGEEER